MVVIEVNYAGFNYHLMFAKLAMHNVIWIVIEPSCFFFFNLFISTSAVGVQYTRSYSLFEKLEKGEKNSMTGPRI